MSVVMPPKTCPPDTWKVIRARCINADRTIFRRFRNGGISELEFDAKVRLIRRKLIDFLKRKFPEG